MVNGTRLERLIEMFQIGEQREEIFHEIHRRYQRSVRLFFARHGFSTEDSRDLSQETFLRLWRGIPDYRGESKFGSWLYTVAANVGRSEISKRKTGKREGETVPFDPSIEDQMPEASATSSSGFSQPLDELLTKEEAAVLRRQIGKLPPRMLRIMLLRLDQGLKLREIAVLEQVSINTVKSQLAQAKARLRLILATCLGCTEGSEEVAS